MSPDDKMAVNGFIKDMSESATQWSLFDCSSQRPIRPMVFIWLLRSETHKTMVFIWLLEWETQTTNGVCLFACATVYDFCFSDCLTVHYSVCLIFCLTNSCHLYTKTDVIYLSLSLSLSLSKPVYCYVCLCLSGYLSYCLGIKPSVSMSVWLSV